MLNGIFLNQATLIICINQLRYHMPNINIVILNYQLFEALKLSHPHFEVVMN